ncbi:DedA family protein, partial [Actinomadura bangladeshensis]|uniref:DedA family protein n=1 Tax=Actinomadura bangladeshensis TaxID=453573 RepID=UPI003C7B00D7
MDGILGVVDTAVTSPWFYLVLFAVAAIDGFFPVVPSESLVITAGVYAASGEPELVPVVVLAALGAFTGDHVSGLSLV